MKKFEIVYPTASVICPNISAGRERSPHPVALTKTMSQSSQEEYTPPVPRSTVKDPQQLSQAEFNDRCRDLKLGVKASELEGSRFAEKGHLQRGVQTTIYRKEGGRKV